MRSLILFLTGLLLLTGCSEHITHGGSDAEETAEDTNQTTPAALNSVTILSPTSSRNIPYATVTIEVNASDCNAVVALNETLSSEQNRTIRLKGAASGGLCYFHNVPLMAGENTVVINEPSGTTLQSVTLTSDANGTAPVGMRADAFSGVAQLHTAVRAGTTLDAERYLFDSDGDGSFDATSADGNFSVALDTEGRYRPRVTVRTTDNLLYSSDDFALSLDVKADANQKDPVGAQPVDIAKAFVKALIANDRQLVEAMLMDSEKWIDMLYRDEARREMMAEKLENVNAASWEQTSHPNGSATVTATIHDETLQQDIPIQFSLTPVDAYGERQGRSWMIRAFY
jgi:hypothetical protein